MKYVVLLLLFFVECLPIQYTHYRVQKPDGSVSVVEWYSGYEIGDTTEMEIIRRDRSGTKYVSVERVTVIGKIKDD